MAMIGAGAAEDTPYVARPLTRTGEFTKGIEGPSCDREGNIYVVNFGVEQTIAKVRPDGRGEVFVSLPGKSVGNGIVFDSRERMFVADYVGHNVLRIDPKTRSIEVFAHAEMHQPNDLAIAPDDTLYASDPDWPGGGGQVWKISTSGKVERVAADMGTTNGIEISPDGKWLYVNESVQRNIWKFPIRVDGTLGQKQLIKQFPDYGFDGMRCDEDGNLYITRHGKGTVVIMTPGGQVLHEVDVLGKSPTNLCFGGPDGKTIYVTEVEHTRLVTFRVETPGLAWRRRQAK
ncbi:SMP-30/gluconolactonase/LRE family protein [Isosphaeraceae bacterium EP7]